MNSIWNTGTDILILSINLTRELVCIITKTNLIEINNVFGKIKN